jgi:predicted AAA+ superfamily ATPase
MVEISEHDVLRRLDFDNPWWVSADEKAIPYSMLPKREYFFPFQVLAEDRTVRRAILLLGPRRVGKTVILYQFVNGLLKTGSAGNLILFLSLETPVYTGIPLEKLIRLFSEKFGHSRNAPLTIIFDEIQYLKDWEVHLKSLVDSYPKMRFIASGSAAAALRLKSRESGAGRFTEFLLPPLTFAEYLKFINREDELVAQSGPSDTQFAAKAGIEILNTEFLNYLNFGCYPEAVFNETVRQDSGRYIKSDIIDKVLLRDLPQLYGIRDVQELNRLFTTLAYNTANEVSLDELSKSSGVSKTTIVRYLEYLEAAFLVKRIYRIDNNARRFQRATSFKIYLTNPSMRAALFGSLANDDRSMGLLAETALFAQWFHNPQFVDHIHYARWSKGEIDMVAINSSTQKPDWCVEVKWSDRLMKDTGICKHLALFCRGNNVTSPLVTTRTADGTLTCEGVSIRARPTSLHVYAVGKNIVRHKVGQLREKSQIHRTSTEPELKLQG